MTQNDIQAEVNQRTNLAFANRMEMLTFYLSDKQQYGINVFKIIEVIETPKDVTKLPQADSAIVGAINFRGKMVTVIDLSFGLGLPGIKHQECLSYVIICEYSNSIQGFLVDSPNKLINVSWEEIISPGKMIQDSGCLTALTYDENGETIQILDVEKILGEIIGIGDKLANALIEEGQMADIGNFRVLVLDDSKAARLMLQKVLEPLRVPYVMFEEGGKALAALEGSLKENQKFGLIISDIEMPGMDGFTFTRKVKSNPELAKIHLVLHSSMSNKTNRDKAHSVGADGFIAKFQPDEIARLVLDQLAKTKGI